MYFAKIENNIVVQVIAADQDFVNTLVGDWIETSTDGTLHKNYAGIGYSWDLERRAFISPKPFNSWLLDQETCRWTPPVTRPNDGLKYFWNEDKIDWEIA